MYLNINNQRKKSYFFMHLYIMPHNELITAPLCKNMY